MPQVIFSPAALRDLERLREFLRSKNLAIGRRAVSAIKETIKLLENNPQIGRTIEGMEPEYRELVISFGKSGYLAMYRFDDNNVTVLALRHQKEAGY